jgi:hypothetical protein
MMARHSPELSPETGAHWQVTAAVAALLQTAALTAAAD